MYADRGAGLTERSALYFVDLMDLAEDDASNDLVEESVSVDLMKEGASVVLVEKGESEMEMSSKWEMSEEESFSGE